MSADIKVRIVGENDQEAAVNAKGELSFASKPPPSPILLPFFNPTKGIDLNQNVSFTGNPTVVHAGVNSGSVLTGTTTGTTASHLIDSGETFSGVAVGMSVKNTTSGNEYALVTNVAANDLTLDNDIFVSGENYEINQIWVGTAVSGTWNFADAGKISITTANNLDEASFDTNSGQTWDTTNFTAFTGKVDLDIFDPANNTILLQFGLDGVPVGSQINLNNIIDTGNFSEQSFVIQTAAFGFGSDLINDLTIIITRVGGSKPTIKFDDLQWEESGESLNYLVQPEQGTKLSVTEIIFDFADDVTGITAVSGATENATMANLSYDRILGLSALTNGILFIRVENRKVTTTISFRQLSHFIRGGAKLDIPISDGTNTNIIVTVAFPVPIVLDGDLRDFMSLTVSDDLSGLLAFTAFARGSLENKDV